MTYRDRKIMRYRTKLADDGTWAIIDNTTGRPIDGETGLTLHDAANFAAVMNVMEGPLELSEIQLMQSARTA